MSEAQFPSAVRTFVLRPGELTAGLLERGDLGWWPPLRLCLGCVIAYFVLNAAVGAIGAAATSPGVPHVTLSADERVRLEGEGTGGALLVRLIDDPASIASAVGAAVPVAMCVLLPFFAFVMMMVYRRAKPGYLPHLLFTLHIHAIFFATMAVGTAVRLAGSDLLDVAVGATALVYTSWYLVAAMQRVYGGSSSSVLARATVVGLAWGAAFAVVAGAASIAMIPAQ